MGPILRAYQAETEPAQKKLYAGALGDSGSAAALDALLALLQFEADPRAMAAVVGALGKYRDPRVALALTQWLELPDRPYRATAAALHALGKQRDVGHVALLTRHAEDTGWWGWVARGALQGLGENGSQASYAALLTFVESGSLPHNLLGTALAALGACARRLSAATRRDAVEHLSTFVRHPDHGTRLAAGRGLVAIGERSGLGALKILRQHASVQHQASVDRMVQRLAKAGEAGDAAKLQSRVDALNDQLRSLQARLDKLEAAPMTDAG
jgi:HEAT repeat protein